MSHRVLFNSCVECKHTASRSSVQFSRIYFSIGGFLLFINQMHDTERFTLNTRPRRRLKKIVIVLRR